MATIDTLPQPPNLTRDALVSLPIEWRERFFSDIQQRFAQGLASEDIDVTHRYILDAMLVEKRVPLSDWDEHARRRLVAAWHHQKPWPDAIPALQRLRSKFFVIVLANGTVRLQLDIAKSSNLPFHTFLNSELLGLTKPDPTIYREAARLMGLGVEDCIMVAAHAYDLRAAKGVGLRTVYVHRRTEDTHEDTRNLDEEFDHVLFDATNEGLGPLPNLLGLN